MCQCGLCLRAPDTYTDRYNILHLLLVQAISPVENLFVFTSTTDHHKKVNWAGALLGLGDADQATECESYFHEERTATVWFDADLCGYEK